jgi:transcriptional regulator with XRE-family HTH domain
MAKKVFRGDRLRQARESHGLTQVEFAKQLGTVQTQIHRYENGKTEPLPEQIVAMAQVLEVSADWLLGLTDDATNTVAEKTLTKDEKRFLEALRHGNFRRLLNLIQEAIPEEQDQSGVSSVEIGIDSESLDTGK